MMRQKKAKLIFVFLLIFGLAELHAQTSLTTSGSNATGLGGSVSYTVGQVVYSTYSDANGYVAQGVQQPFEITVYTGLDNNKTISLVCSAFPNPTSDFLTLRIENEKNAEFIARLYDIEGQQLMSMNIEGVESSIPMKNYAPSIYFLKIFSAKSTSALTEIKSFKIIKK